MSDRPVRIITAKACWVAAVGNDLALHVDAEVWIPDVRMALTERGLFTHERGNQALGDCLGAKGFGLPRHQRKYLVFEAPGTPCPPGWCRSRGFVHPGGLIAYSQTRHVYRWPPVPPGIDRAFLAERFVVPRDWDWGTFGL